jgi:hypothetical protein
VLVQSLIPNPGDRSRPEVEGLRRKVQNGIKLKERRDIS